MILGDMINSEKVSFHYVESNFVDGFRWTLYWLHTSTPVTFSVIARSIHVPSHVVFKIFDIIFHIYICL